MWFPVLILSLLRAVFLFGDRPVVFDEFHDDFDSDPAPQRNKLS